MNHESGKTDQAGQTSTGESSLPNSSRGFPSGETADTASPACGSPDELAAFQGFRLWRVREGQLLSMTNATV